MVFLQYKTDSEDGEDDGDGSERAVILGVVTCWKRKTHRRSKELKISDTAMFRRELC